MLGASGGIGIHVRFRSVWLSALRVQISPRPQNFKLSVSAFGGPAVGWQVQSEAQNCK